MSKPVSFEQMQALTAMVNDCGLDMVVSGLVDICRQKASEANGGEDEILWNGDGTRLWEVCKKLDN